MIQQDNQAFLVVPGTVLISSLFKTPEGHKRDSLFKRSIKADRVFNPDPFADAEASADEADENTSSNKVPSKIHVRVQRTL